MFNKAKIQLEIDKGILKRKEQYSTLENGLKIKEAILNAREKMFDKELALTKAEAEARWEKECYHYAHTIEERLIGKLGSLPADIIKILPNIKPGEVNIHND